MRNSRPERIGGSLLIALLLAPAAWALEGRTLGSVVHTDGVGGGDAMRWLYEMGGLQSLKSDLDLRLRMSLNYTSLMNGHEDALLGSRFYGQLRAPVWRVDAQYVPWQRSALGVSSLRETQSQVGLHVTPPRLPHLDVDYTRLDRQTPAGNTSSESKRIQMGYARGGLGGEAGFRRIDTSPIGIAAASRTDEWRGMLQGTRAFRRGSVQGSYDGLLSRYETRARRLELRSNRLSLTGAYVPVRRLTVSGNAMRRWGSTDDNALLLHSPIDELTFSGNLAYRPVRDLELQLAREYRRQNTRDVAQISDYMQFEALFRRAMARDFMFQAGATSTLDLGAGGDIPNNAGYVLVDGRLRPGVEGRGEVRAARTRGTNGIQWRNLLQLRARPSEPTHIEIGYRRDTMPEFLGLAQTDREWSLLAGYEPVQAASMAVSYRRLDGTGRVARAERQTTLSGTWNLAQRSTLAANWSHRTAQIVFGETVENVLGVDLSFWLPGEWQTRASYRSAGNGMRTSQRSYALSVEKRF